MFVSGRLTTKTSCPSPVPLQRKGGPPHGVFGGDFFDGPRWSFYVYRCVGFAKYFKYIIYKLHVCIYISKEE